MRKVEFFFDVTCPFAWVTSRWIVQAAQVRDLEITWTPMSLAVLNEGRDELPGEYKAKMQANWGPARVFAAVAVNEPNKVENLYTVMGTIIHVEGNGGKTGYGAYDQVIKQALHIVGLETKYAQYANNQIYDSQIRAFHASAMQIVGNDVGTPVVKIGEVAFFGPVMTRIPRGEEAGKIFDAAFELASYPHFFEIKRSRTETPQFEL